MKFGIHVKIGKGLGEAVKTAVSYGCDTFQMFSRSPRGGKARAFGSDELKTFHALRQENSIAPVVVHAPYILNLANPDQEMHDYAISLVREDMDRAARLGAEYLVVHVGSHRGSGEAVGLEQMAKGVRQVLEGDQGNTVILLENTSGAGSELGQCFEHLGWLLKELDSARVGVCFDTCHAFGAGYNLTSQRAVDETLDEFDKLVGLDKLKVIHCNDSAFPQGSKKDRHAHIGQGLIGGDGFKALVNNVALKDIPFILETPVDEKGDWAANLAALRSLVESHDNG